MMLSVMIAHYSTHRQLNSSDFLLLIFINERIHISNIDVDSASGSYLRQVTIPNQSADRPHRPTEIRGGFQKGEESF